MRMGASGENFSLKESRGDVRTSGFAVVQTMMTIFIVLVFLGFPGRLDTVIGGSICTLLDYGSFGLQLLLVLMASGSDVMSIRLIDFKPAYTFLYVYIAFVSLESMAVTIDKKAELITLMHLVVTILFAIWLVERFTVKEILEIVYCAQFIFFGITVICMVIFPNITFYRLEGEQAVRGLFKTKNEFGTQLSFGVLVQCILLRMRLERNERVSILFVGMLIGQIGLVVLSKNFGALLIVITFISYILLYSKIKSKKRLPLGTLFVSGTAGFLVFALTVLQWMEPILLAVGKSADLTGRVPLWKQCITVMLEKNTLTGYGYEMFWRTPSAVDAFHAGFAENSWAATTSSSMHNTMMELWCNIGLMGVALYYVLFLSAERGVKYMEENHYLFCSSYMVMYTVRSLTERQNDPGTFYVLFLFVVLSLMMQSYQEHKEKSRRKANIYEPSDENMLFRDNSDLAAFQRRFSNISEADKKRKNETTGKDAFQRNRAFLEHQKKENKLESLLKQFDDDE